MRARSPQLIIGRLIEHGSAPYQFRPNEALSYFVKLATSRGQKVLWGVDLGRALNAAVTRPRIGDLVGARRVHREAVTLTRRGPDGQAPAAGGVDRQTYRTRWELERLKHFADRARLARRVRDEHADVRESVRAHPELKSTFLTLRSAEAIAARRIANPKDRERFIALVREAMASSIAHGSPLPDARLREKTKEPPHPPGPAPRAPRDEPTR